MVDRLIDHIDLVSVITMALFLFFGVYAAYVRTIEMMFAVLLAQGTLETILNIGKIQTISLDS